MNAFTVILGFIIGKILYHAVANGNDVQRLFIMVVLLVCVVTIVLIKRITK